MKRARADSKQNLCQNEEFSRDFSIFENREYCHWIIETRLSTSDAIFDKEGVWHEYMVKVTRKY